MLQLFTLSSFVSQRTVWRLALEALDLHKSPVGYMYRGGGRGGGRAWLFGRKSDFGSFPVRSQSEPKTVSPRRVTHFSCRSAVQPRASHEFTLGGKSQAQAPAQGADEAALAQRPLLHGIGSLVPIGRLAGEHDGADGGLVASQISPWISTGHGTRLAQCCLACLASARSRVCCMPPTTPAKPEIRPRVCAQPSGLDLCKRG
jgi:hypothetical protein